MSDEFISIDLAKRAEKREGRKGKKASSNVASLRLREQHFSA